MQLNERHREILQQIRSAQSLSRRALHEALAFRPNTVGTLVEQLIERGYLREGDTEPNGRGRPQVPLHIDDQQRCAVGLSLEPRRIVLSKMNLLGRLLDPMVELKRGGQKHIHDDLFHALDQASAIPGCAAIGIGVPGLIDLKDQRLISTAMSRSTIKLELDRLADRVDVPLVIDNDMHGLAAQWLLRDRIDHNEDTLLIYINDGAVGSVMLVDGRPNRGCILGGNELGHMCLNINAPRCACGQYGCIESICSTEFLKFHGHHETLEQAAATFEPDHPIHTICDAVAMGLSNAINFMRVHRVHIVSPMSDCEAFGKAILAATRKRILAGLKNQVAVRWSAQMPGDFSQNAGWLALSAVYYGDWSGGHLSAYQSNGVYQA